MGPEQRRQWPAEPSNYVPHNWTLDYVPCNSFGQDVTCEDKLFFQCSDFLIFVAVNIFCLKITLPRRL